MGINELIQKYLETKDEKIFNEIVNLIKTSNVIHVRISLDKSFLLKEVEGKTILDLLVENNKNASFDWKTMDMLIKDAQLLKILLNNDRYDFIEAAGEDILIQDYFGEPLISYIFKNNKVTPYMVGSFFNNPIIIDLCVKYHKEILLNNLRYNDLLLHNISHDKTVIEYLLEHNMVNSKNIEMVEDIKIFDLIIKYNRLDLLKHINENVLALKYKGRMLLEELLDRGIVPLKIYDNDALVERIIELGKIELLKDAPAIDLFFEYGISQRRLIDYLFDADIIPDNITTETMVYGNNTRYVAHMLCKKGRYDLLQNACEKLLLENVYGENILFFDLLRNGYNPKPENIFRTQAMLRTIIKYNSYDSLEHCSEELLLTKLPNDKLALEELLDRKLTLDNLVYISDPKSIDIIMKYKRYDLLSRASLKLLLNNFGWSDTYLDLGLQYAQTDDEIVSFDKYTQNIFEMAEKYIIFARHNYQMYLPSLTKEHLLAEINGKRLIDILLEKDAKTTVDKVLDSNIKEDFEIAMIIRLNGFKQKHIKFDSITRDFEGEYLKRNNERYDSSKLPIEKRMLIEELRKALNDSASDSKAVEILINAYTYLLSTDSKYAAEIYQIINIKKFNPNFCFRFIKSGACYDDRNNVVYIDDENLDTLNHEMGHALFNNLTDGNLPQGFDKAVEKRKNDPEFIKRAEEYSKMFNLILREVFDRVERTYLKKYDSSITEDVKQEIIEYITQGKDKNRSKYISVGIPATTVDKILNETYTLSEYLDQDRRIKKKKLTDLILRIEYGPFISIGDYIDGLTGGKLKDGILVNNNGEKIKSTYGHGINYYIFGNEFIFDEMIANYSEIIKSESPDEGIEALRYFIGDELTDMLIDYYDKNILNGKKFTESYGRSI